MSWIDGGNIIKGSPVMERLGTDGQKLPSLDLQPAAFAPRRRGLLWVARALVGTWDRKCSPFAGQAKLCR
jgi:hypothetical protein